MGKRCYYTGKRAQQGQGVQQLQPRPFDDYGRRSRRSPQERNFKIMCNHPKNKIPHDPANILTPICPYCKSPRNSNQQKCPLYAASREEVVAQKLMGGSAEKFTGVFQTQTEMKLRQQTRIEINKLRNLSNFETHLPLKKALKDEADKKEQELREREKKDLLGRAVNKPSISPQMMKRLRDRLEEMKAQEAKEQENQ